MPDKCDYCEQSPTDKRNRSTVEYCEISKKYKCPKCCPDNCPEGKTCPKVNTKREVIPCAFSAISNDTGQLVSLAEEVFIDGKTGFCVYNVQSGDVKYEDKIHFIGVTYEPIFNDAVTTRAVLLPSQANHEGLDTLLSVVQAFIHKYVDVSPRFERIASYFVLHTWLYDRSPTTPILRVLGDIGTGKSRFLDTVGGICYKGIKVSGSITPAPIYRLLKLWAGTLILDEADWKDSSEYGEVIKILNSGIEPNRPIIRCNPDNVSEVQFFDVFGPKVIATRQPFKDAALESRCITEILHQTTRTDIPFNLPSVFYKEALELRNRLLYYRFVNYSKISLDSAARVRITGIEPRLQQMVRPFAGLFLDNPSALKDFRDFLADYQREIIETRAATLDGKIVNAIYELWQEYDNSLHEQDFKVTPGTIVERIGENDLSPVSIGKRLKALGVRIEIKRGENNKTARFVVYDKPFFEYLSLRYVPKPVTDDTDVTVTLEDNCYSSYSNENKSADGGKVSVSNVTSVTSVTAQFPPESPADLPSKCDHCGNSAYLRELNGSGTWLCKPCFGKVAGLSQIASFQPSGCRKSSSGGNP